MDLDFRFPWSISNKQFLSINEHDCKPFTVNSMDEKYFALQTKVTGQVKFYGLSPFVLLLVIFELFEACMLWYVTSSKITFYWE